MTNLLVGLKYRSERERESIYDVINNLLTSEVGPDINFCNNLVYLLLPNIHVRLLTNNNYSTSSSGSNNQLSSAIAATTINKLLSSKIILDTIISLSLIPSG